MEGGRKKIFKYRGKKRGVGRAAQKK